MIVVAGGIAYWMLQTPTIRIARQGLTQGNIILAALWSFMGFCVLKYPIFFGLSLLFGHRKVEVCDDVLICGESLGIFGRKKRWPVERIKRLQVVSVLPNLPNDDSEPGLPDNFHILTAILDDGKRIVIAPFYPKRLLESLAKDLSTQLSLAVEKTGLEAPASFDDVASEPGQPLEKAPVEVAPGLGLTGLIQEAAEALQKARDREIDVVEQPSDSPVVVDSNPRGIRLEIPPPGIWHGSAGLFQFGIIWSLAIAGFTTIFLIAGMAQKGDLYGFLGLFVCMLPFWASGAGMLLVGYNMGTRMTVIEIVGDLLIVTQTGLRGMKRREWPRTDVRTVRVGPSGMEVNDKDVPELQILGARDKLQGLLVGRDPQELLWMATLLRYALKPTESSSPITSEAAHRPAAGGEVAAFCAPQ
jgi:hypothetical protein